MPVMDQASRCSGCGEVIGVYEPVVVREGASPRNSSLAAEPALAGAPAQLYHQACHAALAQRERRLRTEG